MQFLREKKEIVCWRFLLYFGGLQAYYVGSWLGMSIVKQKRKNSYETNQKNFTRNSIPNNGIVFVSSIVLSIVQYILQGKVDMVDKVVEVIDDITNYINPDC